MSEIEKAKIYHVSGPVDRPQRSGEGIAVMFNPANLKVTLANAIGENQRGGNSRAAQYIDKSSSSLTVELIFDSSIEFDQRNSVRKDVRQYTGQIANEFMKQERVGNKDAEPKRCMFVWGTFKFVGIMESFDETLDFFSKEGTPLRSTVSIKMTESRFQFESEPAKEARRRTPRLGRDNESPHEANQGAGQNPKDWRDTSMYNGVESPRMPSASSMAVPSMSAGASFSAGISGGAAIGMSAGAGIGVGGGAGIGGGIGGAVSMTGSASFSAGAGLSVTNSVSISKATPAFSFGASSSLGSTIPGAFSPNTKVSVGVTAGGIVAAMKQSSTPSASTNSFTKTNNARTTQTRSARVSAQFTLTSKGAKGSVGFD